MRSISTRQGLVALAAMCMVAVSTIVRADEQDLKVYPPHWWAGMASPALELMLHGEDIADSRVTTDSVGVTIDDVTRLDSNNYLFVSLNLANAKDQTLSLRLLDKKGTVRVVPYSLHARRKHSSQREGFSGKDAIYLIAPDRFANGEVNNDEVAGYREGVTRDKAGGRHGGDIQGIMNNLSYVSSLGFTQVWTMPLLENAMEDYSYHGYSITDFYNIDPRFGTNALFKEMSSEAREQGIGIIMDMVLNHIGSSHIWLSDAPSSDWINNNGRFVGTTHKRESLHDPHGVDADKKAFSNGWFVPTMPDLNQRNPHLANYLIQQAIWWVEYADLSGIRVDTYSYSDKAFLSAWTQRLMAEYPRLNIVGEEWSVNPAITAYWQRGSYRRDGYESALPSVMDFPLQQAVIEAINSKESWSSGLTRIYETLATDFLYGNANDLVVFADNHDMRRVFTQVDGDLRHWNMAMTFFLTTRGIPQVFYGSEILMDNGTSDDHGIIRADFPGGWPDDKINAFTGKGLTDSQHWATSRIKTLLHLRRQYPALFEGNLTHYAPEEGIYTYFRHTDDPASPLIMVVLNKQSNQGSDTEDTPVVSLDIGKYERMLKGKTTLVRLRDDKQFRVNETITLSPMSASVFIVK
ncbi:glycoside hydrolase family 13 protein [Alteromonas sp. A079]|uniref:glycoside hydrolase family 13 protein n=1 Tax=Alteromonas sp. A079 TaxID=3410268 RepID=UPI003BA20203